MVTWGIDYTCFNHIIMVHYGSFFILLQFLGIPRALDLVSPKGHTLRSPPWRWVRLVAYADASARHAMRSRSSQSARAAVSGLVAPVGLERCLRLQHLLP